MYKLGKAILCAAALIALAGGAMADEPAFFSEPEAAVTEITRLMRAEAWPELARYYDLTGSAIAEEDLASGVFFVRDEPPPGSHPAGFGRYIQPFAPGFTYAFHETKGDGTIEVTVEIAIDEGGGLIQRGFGTFTMRQTPDGYRLLPKDQR